MPPEIKLVEWTARNLGVGKSSLSGSARFGIAPHIAKGWTRYRAHLGALIRNKKRHDQRQD